ncbi:MULTISPECIES: GH3 auxin-responsive promoter family protein [Aquimarina]|uniref:GH3 auxin-responsive promoter family protein n=1 Tax=Aquimarina algiphila TaxID=2047982 RepID=A0A554VG17_9FLAO|nr:MULTISPECIES: GH3 auxin-responsive promoter family protein [Aquimarina]TSE06291.1 GH3 auxin-responsive promoter family protein [Aquimarina algiphila]
MSLKSLGAKIFAKRIRKKINKWSSNPIKTQEKVFKDLIKVAGNTAFGKDHNFQNIKTHSDFVKNVPIRDYEQLKSYVNRVVDGEKDVLWPGKPLYFAKTSGTTSGAKYIPLTKDSMPTHIRAARNAILCYIEETGKVDFVDGKMIFLQGSPEMEEKNGVMLGRLSGIVAHYVPKYLQKNRLPSWETNCIEDWEEKVDAIVEETIHQNMTVISGIPPWVQMYFEKLQQKTNKTIGDLFKGFELFIYGGVNFEPYKATFEKLIGRKVAGIELYPASEGFFAFQDKQNEKGMLLQLDSGMFYEFVKAEEFFEEKPKRLTIGEVEKGVNYVMLVSTTAGLWSYNIGDTVMFTCTTPYRLIVSGRIKHFISAFGEHVIGKEVDQALKEGADTIGAMINDFTVAPQVNPDNSELPYHEWFIEFKETPVDIEALALEIENSLRRQNSYYDDLIEGKILRTLKITPVPKDGFKDYMRSVGKLGGQNKLPRLSNDRNIADKLTAMIDK